MKMVNSKLILYMFVKYVKKQYLNRMKTILSILKTKKKMALGERRSHESPWTLRYPGSYPRR